MPTVEHIIDPDNVWLWQGAYDISGGAFPTADSGYVYYISVGGTADGVTFAVGDLLVSRVDSASTTTFANNWLRIAPTPSTTVNDGTSVDFTASGTDNQTFTAELTGFNAAADESYFSKSGAALAFGPNAKFRDADNDTLIQLEETGDEDIIRFDAAGTEQATIAESAIQLNSDAADTLTIRGATLGLPDYGNTDTQGLIRPLVLDGTNNVIQSFLELISDADGDTDIDTDFLGSDSDDMAMGGTGAIPVFMRFRDADGTGLPSATGFSEAQANFAASVSTQCDIRSADTINVPAAGGTLVFDADASSATFTSGAGTRQEIGFLVTSGAAVVDLVHTESTDTAYANSGVYSIQTRVAGAFGLLSFTASNSSGINYLRPGGTAVTIVPSGITNILCTYNNDSDTWDIFPAIPD